MSNTLKNIQPLILCPVCQKKYAPDKVLLLDEDGKKATFHLSCEACGVSSLVFVSLSSMGAVSFGILTDLERDEVREFFGSDAVTDDDALEAYRFLKGFRGGVSEYLES